VDDRSAVSARIESIVDAINEAFEDGDGDVDELEDKDLDALINVILDKQAAEHEAVCDDEDCEGA
jgi:hypothetical protein